MPINIDWNHYYRWRTGNDPPLPLTPEVFFRASFIDGSTIHEGAFRPVGLVTDPFGFEIETTRFTHFADSFDAFPMVKGDGLDADFWCGGSSWGAVPFFQPRRNLKMILDEYDSTLVMRIKLISVGATGIRIPTHMILCRDPQEQEMAHS